MCQFCVYNFFVIFNYYTTQKTILTFSKCSEKLIFPKNRTRIWSFWYHHHSCIHGNMTFSVFIFPTNMKLRFCQKSKDDILSQNTFKDDIPGIKMIFIKKMIFIVEKMILEFYNDILERAPKIFCNFMETFLSVFVYCFPMKKKQET